MCSERGGNLLARPWKTLRLTPVQKWDSDAGEAGVCGLQCTGKAALGGSRTGRTGGTQAQIASLTMGEEERVGEEEVVEAAVEVVEGSAPAIALLFLKATAAFSVFVSHFLNLNSCKITKSQQKSHYELSNEPYS